MQVRKRVASQTCSPVYFTTWKESVYKTWEPSPKVVGGNWPLLEVLAQAVPGSSAQHAAVDEEPE